MCIFKINKIIRIKLGYKIYYKLFNAMNITRIYCNKSEINIIWNNR